MHRSITLWGTASLLALVAPASVLAGEGSTLGLPPLLEPLDNPGTPQKVRLGDRLFHDERFSSTQDVSCATCHLAATGFTDSPKRVSRGIEGKAGTRNAPTVLNAAFYSSQFWDGRSPSLEDQALHPFTNPVEMGLKDHGAILRVVQGDAVYRAAFKEVFGVASKEITMTHVTRAIAAFERTIIAGDSPFDRWFYADKASAMTPQQVRGYELYINKARCVSCHVIEQTQATFTDSRFHNIGVGLSKLAKEVPQLTRAFLKAQRSPEDVDLEVLTNAKSSELGRFAVKTTFDGLGAFKTPTLRNIDLTAPYMHDGSIATLEKVVEHYNNGGLTTEGDPVSPYLSGGIRPLNLSAPEQADLVAFLEALTSSHLPHPEFADKAK